MTSSFLVRLLAIILLSLTAETLAMPLRHHDIYGRMGTGEEGDYFEGDIILPEWDELDRSVVLDPARLWKNGTVYYYIDSDFDADARQKILSAFHDFHLLSCIQFVPRTYQDAYVHIVNEEGCASPVGYRDEEIILRLHASTCLQYHGTILHELMHVLGFWHEHTRYDRDKYVSVMWNNIQPGKEHDFLIHGLDETQTLGLPYDYKSVLHYNRYTFSVSHFLPTLIPSEDVDIGQRVGFSRGDLAKINRLYSCAGYYMGDEIHGGVQYPYGATHSQHYVHVK